MPPFRRQQGASEQVQLVMVKTTRSLECLLATGLVCGCLVWRFAAPPVTPEWVELLRLRKDNDLLLQSSTVQSAVGARLAARGGLRRPGREDGPLGAQPLP